MDLPYFVWMQYFKPIGKALVFLDFQTLFYKRNQEMLKRITYKTPRRMICFFESVFRLARTRPKPNPAKHIIRPIMIVWAT